MMLPRRALPLLFVLAACLPAWPQEREARIAAVLPEIDKLYTELAAEKHIPGIAYAVIVDGKPVQVRGIGYADVEAQTPVTGATAFRIASMTKSFVAMAVLRLRDAGKLHLDDPAARYLPELRKLRLPTSDSPPLSIRQLMTMTTGLPEDNPWGDRQMARSNAELERIVGAGLSFSNAPGVENEYSNLGYVMLGKLVSRVSGMRYQDYITRNILLPLGMKDTLWEYSKVAPGKLAIGYNWEHERFVREPILHDGDGAAMGGLITTMDDFARYVAFHLAAWPARDGEDKGPLRRASVREMHMPASFLGLGMVQDSARAGFYGFGLRWVRDQKNGTSMIGHSGGLPGYGSQFQFLPSHGVAVVAFSNLRYGPVYAPTGKALAMLVEKAKLEGAPVVPAPELLARQQQVAQLVQTWDEALGNAVVAENFFLDRSREDWIAEARSKLAPIGKVVSVGPMKAQNRLRGRFVITGETGAVEVFFTLTPEHEPKVQQLVLQEVKP
jgi:CubicO group peptidase (beta-lactamase class C family)